MLIAIKLYHFQANIKNINKLRIIKLQISKKLNTTFTKHSLVGLTTLILIYTNNYLMAAEGDGFNNNSFSQFGLISTGDNLDQIDSDGNLFSPKLHKLFNSFDIGQHYQLSQIYPWIPLLKYVVKECRFIKMQEVMYLE